MLYKLIGIARARHLVAAAALLLGSLAHPLQAAQVSVNVAVKVQLISTSGACAARQAQAGMAVVCGLPVVLSGRGASGTAPQLRGSAGPATIGLPATLVAASEAAPGRSARVEISSWRMVSLDNGAYVELTIAW